MTRLNPAQPIPQSAISDGPALVGCILPARDEQLQLDLPGTEVVVYSFNTYRFAHDERLSPACLERLRSRRVWVRRK